MKFFLLIALAIGSVGCANRDPYQDPTYTLQRNLYNRNQNWDAYQNRQYLRRQAQDGRYQAWFNSVME
ncbi:MAG: hypothetical protein WEC73_05485 [Chthoniobacterales bacterium]